ncbi:Hypothetical_protein [Hexamita inflata]|uniref:Hypothetical_protein n=1 Tax=Hexamita inflata TaxID=28002 RepID=A0AA86R2L6_9EUKA|nr:Hypothetical protein HINF_LOCUS55692 [Hexamita inflata]
MFTLLYSLSQVCRGPSGSGARYVCGQNTACDKNNECIRNADLAICNTMCKAVEHTTGSCVNTFAFTMNTYPSLDTPTTENAVYYCQSSSSRSPTQSEGINWAGSTMIQHYVTIPIFIVICWLMHLYCFKHRAEWDEKNRIRREKKLALKQVQFQAVTANAQLTLVKAQ